LYEKQDTGNRSHKLLLSTGSAIYPQTKNVNWIKRYVLQDRQLTSRISHPDLFYFWGNKTKTRVYFIPSSFLTKTASVLI
jgi:hypothetical protein